jgi:hypothetical protein
VGVERGSTMLDCLENSLWKKLWTCRKTDYVMVVVMMMYLLSFVFQSVKMGQTHFLKSQYLCR